MAVGAFIHPWESVIGLGIVGMGIGIRKAYDHELDSVLYKNPFSEVADELEGRRHELLEMAKTYRS